MRYTFASFAFGCRVNQAEKEQLDRALEISGLIYNSDNPDFYIINSCAVTGKAEHEVRQYINHIHRTLPQTSIVVTGCAATRWIRDKEHVSEAALLIDNYDKLRLDTILISLKKPSKNKEQSVPRKYSDKFIQSGRVMVKLQDGCSRFCSFCIVPYLRGKPTSRTITDIVEEIKRVEHQTTEVILTAINTEYFGKGNKESIPKLMEVLFSQTSIKRFSFGSIHPWSLNDEFIDWYKEHKNNPRLVHFFHVPLQSGNDDVLHRMNRGYRIGDIVDTLEKLKIINNELLLGTDIIVGFLGETKEEFEMSYKILQGSPIDRLHVFRFSQRIGTKAYTLRNSYPVVSSKEKIERTKKFITLSENKFHRFQQRLTGSTRPALFLLEQENNILRALLPNQVEIYIRTKECIQPGTIQNILVTRFEKGKLFGDLYKSIN